MILMLFVGFDLLAQTANDNMEDAEVLKLNQFVNSSTHGNTLQRNCIDEKLTSKCVKYHNDQWFRFNSGTLDNVYINISGQACRDLYGVQLIVLEGELCSTSTYNVLACQSLGTQDDVFVHIRNLSPRQNYWLNVDGYLHDFCEFFIEVSDEPKGISAEQTNLMNTQGDVLHNIVTLKWTIPDSLADNSKSVQVLKRVGDGKRFDILDSLEVSFNAFGEMEKDYIMTDTLLQTGRYYYRLVLEEVSGKRTFMKEYNFRVSPPSVSDKSVKTIGVKMDYRKGSALTLSLIDTENETVLDKLNFTFNPIQHTNFILFVDKYLQRGITSLEVRIHDNDLEHTTSQYFDLKE